MISFGGSAQSTTVDAVPAAVTAYPTVADGDLLVVLLFHDQAMTSVNPGGWTLRRSHEHSVGTSGYEVWTKTASGESGTYDFGTATPEVMAHLHVYADSIGGGDWLFTDGSDAESTSTELITGAVNVTIGGIALCGFGNSSNRTVATPPAGATLAESGTLTSMASASYYETVVAGETKFPAMVWSGSGPNTGALLLIGYTSPVDGTLAPTLGDAASDTRGSVGIGITFSFGGSAQAENISAVPAAVTAYPAVADGDLLVVAIVADFDLNTSDPGGWVKQRGYRSPFYSLEYEVWTKTASGESGTYNFGSDSGTVSHLMVYAKGAGAGTWAFPDESVATGGITTTTFPVWVADSDFLQCVFCNNSARTVVTPPVGMTLAEGSNPPTVAINSYYEDIHAADFASRSVTWSDVQGSIGGALVIRWAVPALPDVDGTFLPTLDDATSATVGALPVSGTLTSTLDDATSATEGVHGTAVDGTLTSTLDDAASSMRGVIGTGGPFSFGGSAQAVGINTAPAAVAAYPSVADGDLLVAVLVAADGMTTSDPGGWVQQRAHTHSSDPGLPMELELWTKVASGESGTYNFGSDAFAVSHLLVFTGDTGGGAWAFPDEAVSEITDIDTAWSNPVTAAVDDFLVCAFSDGDDNVRWLPYPVGMTHAEGSELDERALHTYYEEIAGGGTQTRSQDWLINAGYWITEALVIRYVVPPPVGGTLASTLDDVASSTSGTAVVSITGALTSTLDDATSATVGVRGNIPMDFLNIFKHLLPRARAWQITVDKQLRQFFDGLGGLPSDIKTFFDGIWQDIFPQTTRELDEWETQFNLTNIGLTEQERRDRLDASWAATGGQSPKYIQDTLQANGFDVYVHEWWEPGTEPLVGVKACTLPRSPLLYLSRDGFVVYLTEADEPLAECGEAVMDCGETVDPTGYTLVNVISTSGADFVVLAAALPDSPQCGDTGIECGGYVDYIERQVDYLIPLDTDTWPYFLYIGGAAFPDGATVSATRREEFESLCLKLCPTQNWLGMLINYV